MNQADDDARSRLASRSCVEREKNIPSRKCLVHHKTDSPHRPHHLTRV